MGVLSTQSIRNRIAIKKEAISEHVHWHKLRLTIHVLNRPLFCNEVLREYRVHNVFLGYKEGVKMRLKCREECRIKLKMSFVEVII
jgi:hypothetical protein